MTLPKISALFALSLLPSLARSTSQFRPALRHRNLEAEEECDVSFIECLVNDVCAECFSGLETRGIAWPTSNSLNPCEDVVSILNEKNICGDLNTNGVAKDFFCKAYNNCMAWEDTMIGEDDDMWENENGDEEEERMDCSALTKCEWDGFHQGFIGDGSCNVQECYNSAICNYDGGDCCPDTCETESDFVNCGDDHYRCKDPKSAYCDDAWVRNSYGQTTYVCPRSNSTKSKEARLKCDEGETHYKLSEFDSFGDGWGKTKVVMREKEEGVEDGTIIFEGGLKGGFEGIEHICLKKGCYSIKTSGGVWGNEVYWDLRQNDNTPPIAYGGAPTDCTFAIGADVCENTCFASEKEGEIDVEYDDIEWETYQDMELCIESKCVIQAGMCTNDKDCSPCLTESNPTFCNTNANYNALIQCTLCNCVKGDIPESCFDKPSKQKKTEGVMPQCTPQETLIGTSAIMTFSECSNVDQFKAIMSDWDENNFGALDQFESCSHTYNNDYAHGGKTALECMRILYSIHTDVDDHKSSTSPVPEAIKEIADSLYLKPQEFCDCAADSNKLCPACDSFIHFKTLLHESLDACNSLDQIDCPAWAEFAEPCKAKMLNEFHSIDFNSQPQCEYIKTGCGGVGAFPAFRRLDCGKEISKNQWDFYQLYQRGCVGDGPPVSSPVTRPVSSPVQKPTSQVKPAQPDAPKPYTPKDYKPAPYIPTPSSSSSYVPNEKRHHPFLWIFILGGIGMGAFFLYKRQNQAISAFQFSRFRRQTNEQLYSGLFDAEGSGSFEPPSFLPAPVDNTATLT